MNKEEKIALTKEWYAKLKASGFNDIEYFNSDCTPRDILKDDLHKQVELWRHKYQSIEQYYIYARQLIWHGTFDKDIDKTIWVLHAEGLSYDKIAKDLKVSKFKVLTSVQKIRKQIKELMLADEELTKQVLEEV